MRKGDQPRMGSTVVRGEVEATVQFTGVNTFFGKTADLLNTDKGMGHLQKMLLGIVTGLTIYTLILCIICFIYLVVKCALAFGLLTACGAESCHGAVGCGSPGCRMAATPSAMLCHTAHPARARSAPA
jgi:E1-E2 ATPase